MEKLQCVGVDVFVVTQEITGLPSVPETFENLKLEAISTLGLQVWPGALPEGSIGPWFRCRYLSTSATTLDNKAVERLVREIEKKEDWEKVQKLFRSSDGVDRFSKSYGA